ncbi:MAG: hypothetical protein SPJ54_04905 [Candidatus Onthomorpha sp.]|nr:hypothetical protein [Candidatus Onthomorpha sp.]
MKLRKQLRVASANSGLLDDERINQIYEYCIEEVIRQQATEFYADFPLCTIKDDLIEDFVRMEFFRRKDNFGDFCLALYQQIERMTNTILSDERLSDITKSMWELPAYLNTKECKNPPIFVRSYRSYGSDYTIAKLLFPYENKQSGNSNASEKIAIPLQKQSAKDKMRIIVYFLGYKAMMKSSDYDSFKEVTSLLKDIYQCRNMNHRGNSPSPEIQDRILPLKSLYYFKFLGVLAQYVEYIKEGYDYLPTIYAELPTILNHAK